MRNILDYIEKIKSENEGPRITVQEPRNMNQASLADDLEPGPLKDEMLKGFDPSQETYEEYLQRINLERPFNMNQGGRIGFARGSPGADMQEILNAYKEYKRSHHRGKRRSPIIPFKKFFEIYAPENMAEGGRAGYNDGQLVTPSVDGSRPGYSGVYKRQDKPGRAVKWRVQGERGGVNVGKWLKSQGIATTYTNKKAAEKAYKKFLDANPETKGEITKAKWMTEGEALAKKYNAIVETAFKAGDMSKTPAWETFLKTQDLKHAGINHYKSNRVNVGAVNISPMKRQLVDSLIEDANKKLKHTDWMDIQKKVSTSPDINTTQWREYIDKLDSRTKKVNKAFDHLLKNDVALKIPKDLGKTMTKHGSLLRKVISDITGVNSNKIIRDGLNSNTNYMNKIKQIEFANQGNLWTEGEGRTLKEILNDADYRMDGNISWSSDIKKLADRPNKNAFDYALRNFNYYGKRGQVGQIQFYYKGDTEMKNPIKWDEIEWDNKGGKKLKPSKVFFVDSTEKKPIKTQWTIEKIDADHANWKNKKPTIGLLDELYQAKDVYDNLLLEKVTDPRNPNGPKVKFGKIMQEVYGVGYNNFGNPYAIEHGDGVAKNPWKNLRIAESRVNQALFNITDKYKGLDEGVRKKIINELNKKIYDPYDPKTISKIISGQKPIIQSILGEGKIPEQKKLIPQLLDNFWCGTKQSAAGGGRIGFSGSCPVEVKQKNFIAFNNDVANGKITGKAAEEIAKNTAKVVAKAGSKSALASLLGPAGIGIDVIYEVGSIGTDMLMNNVSFKEAMQNNWLTGAFIEGTGQEEYNKGLTKKYSEAKPMATIQNLIEKIESEEKNLERIKTNLVRGDYTGEAKKEILAKQEEVIKNLYNDFDKVARKKTTSPGHPEGEQVRYLALEEGSPEQIAYDQAKLKYDSGREAKAAIKRKSKAGFEESLKSSRAEPWIDFGLSINPQYGKYSKRELDQRLKKVGDYYGYGWTPYGLGYGMEQRYTQPGIGDMKYNKDLGYRQIAEIMADSEARDRIAQTGGISKMAGGGMVGIRKPSAIPPESGPQSQGLASLKKYGSYY